MYVAVLIGLAGFLIFSILAAITFGNADLSLKDVYSVIAYKLFHIKSLSAYAEGAVHDVVWMIRLPRVLLALAVGMALSVCGVVMQAIVQNPLADPYVLGISSGASLGATLAIMLGIGSFLGGNSVGITAFIGAMITSFAVIAIANTTVSTISATDAAPRMTPRWPASPMAWCSPCGVGAISWPEWASAAPGISNSGIRRIIGGPFSGWGRGR